MRTSKLTVRKRKAVETVGRKAVETVGSVTVNTLGREGGDMSTDAASESEGVPEIEVR